MKACHITTVHDPFDTRIFYKECRTLSREGRAVTLVAPAGRSEVVEGVKIVAVKKARNRLVRLLCLGFNVLPVALKQEADIYHIHDPELLLVGALLKLVKGRKIVYDVHEDYGRQVFVKEYIPRSLRKVVSCVIDLVEKFLSGFYDGIVVATDGILRKFDFRESSVCVMNYPVVSDYPRSECRVRGGAGGFRLIYIGGISSARGAAEMISAIGLVAERDAMLTLYGKFHYNKCENTPNENVLFKGWVEPAEIPRILRDHDVGIVCLHPTPNYFNAMPVKMFEYMASGLPVIASNFPLWKEIVEGNECGICVDPLEPEEIAGAIKRLMDDPVECRRMGENGRRAVMEKYNWENESGKLLKLYSKIGENIR